MTERLYAAVLEIRGYIVGDTNSRSGFHVRNSDGAWQLKGWSNIRTFGLAHSGEAILMAAGNGVLISFDAGTSWRVTTDWRITEVLDVAVSPFDPELIIAATAHGFWKSRDLCQTWSYLPVPESNRFCQSIAFDRKHDGTALAAAQTGILLTTDLGSSWTNTQVPDTAGSIRHLTQDSAEPDMWWAASSHLGVLKSVDSGRVWKSLSETCGNLLYCVLAKDSLIVATGYKSGIHISDDHGTSWSNIPFLDASLSGHALAVDPVDADALIVGTTTHGLYRFDLKSGSWTDEGLLDATVRGLYVW